MKGRGRDKSRVREEYREVKREVKRERGGDSGEGREKGGDIVVEERVIGVKERGVNEHIEIDR